MTLKNITASLFSLLLIVVSLLILSQNTKQADASGPFGTNIGYTATSSALVSVSGANSVRIASTSTNPIDPNGSFNRLYTTICSTSTTPVVLNMDGDKPANANNGYTAVIAAAAGYDACYEITDRNLYMGSITASSTGASVSVSVKQYVQ